MKFQNFCIWVKKNVLKFFEKKELLFNFTARQHSFFEFLMNTFHCCFWRYEHMHKRKDFKSACFFRYGERTILWCNWKNHFVFDAVDDMKTRQHSHSPKTAFAAMAYMKCGTGHMLFKKYSSGASVLLCSPSGALIFLEAGNFFPALFCFNRLKEHPYHWEIWDWVSYRKNQNTPRWPLHLTSTFFAVKINFVTVKETQWWRTIIQYRKKQHKNENLKRPSELTIRNFTPTFRTVNMHTIR